MTVSTPAIQLSAIISRHDEINFQDGQAKFDFMRPTENQKPIFSGNAGAEQSADRHRYKNNTKKMPIVYSNIHNWKIFLVNAKISSMKPDYSANDRIKHRLIVQIW
ncbi:hypothetical protein [Agrobacterium sp. OT33]|uniref:hypothetical protein n=1 Tax=Agrobacterium sp. OT33 TaxID=2815338 RepID=UPI001A8D7D33|nr:hypothetical protein [Agrobacterium sp. OT33]MBO0127393.1 hypothetical protein [Agrobacterium sp. OT33]